MDKEIYKSLMESITNANTKVLNASRSSGNITGEEVAKGTPVKVDTANLFASDIEVYKPIFEDTATRKITLTIKNYKTENGMSRQIHDGRLETFMIKGPMG